MVRVRRWRDIFRDPSREDPPELVEPRRGATVADYLPKGFHRERMNYVALNGRPLRGAEVDTLEPRDGDVIECADVPGIIAALVGITAASTALLVAVADFILIAALSIGISYGVAALASPQRLPKYNDEDGPTRAFDGIQDTSGNGRPIPFIYGKVRCGGHFLQSFERLPAGTGATKGVTSLYTLLGVAMGPLWSISDVQINGQPLSIYNSGAPAGEEPIEAWIRLGTADQSPIPAFGAEVVHEVVHRRAIRQDEPPQSFVTTGSVDAFEVTWRFPNGLFKQGSSGIKPYTVKFLVEWRPWGSSLGFEHHATKTISASNRGPWKDQLRVDGLDRAAYEIRITRLTLDDEKTTKSDLVTASVSEVYAISEIAYGSSAHPGIALVGLRTDPSPQLNSAVPSAYTWLAEGFEDIRIYSDEDTYAAGYSENPAWCAAHFITHPLIGMGDRYTYENIDLPSFLAWAAYCDALVSDGKGGLEKRCTIGHIFDEYLPAQDILEVFTQGTGATLVLWGDKWRAVLDTPDEMVWIGNEANIIPGSFRSEWIETKVRANRIHGVFTDAELDYQRESTVVELPDLQQGDAYVETSREFFGVTRRSQVEREITRLLLHNKYADEKVTLEAGLDSLRVAVGSVFGVSMPAIGVGIASGKIVSVDSPDATLFTIDAEVTLEAGKAYEVYVYHRLGGKIDRKSVAFNPGITNQIAADDGNWTAALEAGDMYSLGETAVQKYRCIRATLTNDFHREITGLKYDAKVYTWDLNSPPTVTVNSIPDPRRVPPDPENLALFERQEFSQDGSMVDVIDVDWTAPVSAVLDHYEVWWRQYGEVAWILAGTTRQSRFELKPAQAPGVTYQVAATSVSGLGAKKSPDQVASRILTTTGLLTQPPTLGGLQAYVIDGTLIATCNPVAPEDLGPGGYYEWRRGAAWSQSVLLEKTKSPRLELRSYARGTTTILVKAVNSVGNASPEAASVSITLYGQVEENVILSQAEHPSWGGALLGLQKDGSDRLTLYEPSVNTVFIPAKPLLTRGARFLSFGYPPAEPKIVLVGTYTTQPITVSGGETVKARADVEVVFEPIAIGLGTFDEATFSFDDPRAQIPFSGEEPDKVKVTIESRVSTTDTQESSWSPWVEHQHRAELTMRYIQFRLVVTVESDAYSVLVEEMSITIDLPEKYYTGTHQQLSATSFEVDYPSNYFVAVKRLLVSVIGGAAGDTPRVTAQDETGFTAEIRDGSGALTTGSLHYEALGY